MEIYKAIHLNENRQRSEEYTFKANSFIHAMNYAYELYKEKLVCVYMPKYAHRVEMLNAPAYEMGKVS